MILARTIVLGVAIAVGGILKPANAATYLESVDGDLSGVPAAPTNWPLSVGSNRLAGEAGTGVVEDYDLVAFTIPSGHQLDSIIITAFHVSARASFFGLQEGSPWNDGLGYDLLGDDLVGWTLINNSMTGVDLLPRMQNAYLPAKFEIPLSSGVYTLEIQDVDVPFQYDLAFHVSAVPEPTTAALACAVIAAAGKCRRRGSGRLSRNT